jgi:hypothetical protein
MTAARVLEALRPYLLPLLVLVLTWAVIASVTPSFRGAASAYSVLEGFALAGLVALGLAATIIAGELDLSVGSMAALAAIVMVLCEGAGLVGAIAIATAAGIAFAPCRAG